MRFQSLGAVVFISVDLPSDGFDDSSRPAVHAIRTAERVLEQLNAAAMPATWFACDPAKNEMLARSLAAGIGHAAGLRVEEDFAATEPAAPAARCRLVADILARTKEARSAGISLSTLALRDATAAPAELLVKYGYSAVRSAALVGSATADDAAGIVPLRFGLWLIPHACSLTGRSRLAEWHVASRIRRSIDRSIRNRSPLHLAIDIGTISRGSVSDRLGALPSVLRHIERRRLAGSLAVCTSNSAIAQISTPAPIRASGSILRAA